nr:2-hydroxy-6-oxo-6-phenylhexa-2,4-dienoate hydrolase [uncultured bacterium]
MKKTLIVIATLLISISVRSQLIYPYPVQSLVLTIEGKHVKMAYMDIKQPGSSPVKNILLLHGKNFNGYYWKELIPLLIGSGYRVIVPDQPGWGKSDRIDLHYSFQMLAASTRILLQSLEINKIIVLGHSMGGMLATRFALMYPEMTEKLVLEDPIGLEDYKSFVPYQPIDSLFKKERSATYESYKKYQQSYYPLWKPDYEQYVKAQATDLERPDFDSIAFINAITYQMIYEQPICYEFDKIKIPTLIIIGKEDHTIVGKDKLSEEAKKIYGNYPTLGRLTQEKIQGSTLILLDAIGHIPHVQDISAFWKSIKDWLQ